MNDRLDSEKHPVAYGLLALLGVAAVVGLIMGLGALAGAKVAGLDGEATSGSTGDGASMFLPKPQKTTAATGPSITLAPGEESSGSTGAAEPQESKSKKQEREISLSASQTEASPMEQIDLTGVYPGGEGAILQVQRFESGQWADFSTVTASVSNETFATYVQVGQPGANRFRVIDESAGLVSNEVKVTIR